MQKDGNALTQFLEENASAELMDYQIGASGEKDIFSYLEEMRGNGFDAVTLQGFGEGAFVAKTGIKGKYFFSVFGIDGKIGAPTLAQIAIKNGGLKVSATLAKALNANPKIKRALDNAFRQYAQAEKE